MSNGQQTKRTVSSRASLKAGLKQLGIRPGDLLIVHSSMKSIGPVEGGPETVIEALQESVSGKGTLLMPAFSYSFETVYEPVETYAPETTPSRVGLVSEIFRQQPGVVRSRHPTHSVAAWGKLAHGLVECHDPLEQAHVFAPFEQAARQGATVLLIGCDFTSLSLLHAAEELAPSPYLPVFNWGHLGWRPSASLRDEHSQPMRVPLPHVPGCSRNFGVAQVLAKEHGLLREGSVGSARALRIDAKAILELVTTELRRQPDRLLCPAGSCRACDQRRAVFEHSTPEAGEIARFMVDVISRCGSRLAGSSGEEAAAGLIARRMEELGLSPVKTLHFPIRAWQPGFSTLEVHSNRTWEFIPTAPVAHSPPSHGTPIEGRTVHLECFAEWNKLPDRQGAIGVLWDGYGESHEEFRSLMGAGFAAFLLIDKRFPHEDVVANGVPAQWLKSFTTPMISVPHPQAVRWFGRGPVDCRIAFGGQSLPGESTVVTGEIPGSGPGVILICGHHDTTFNNTGPDDNLCGVAVALEIARLLRERELTPRHTLRFCSFGAEEQLSEGARWYAFESGLARNVRMVVNSDSCGAWCGTTGIHVTGNGQLLQWVRRKTQRSPLQFKILEEICPFSDQFPFNCLGAQSLWFYRQTLATGRHFHHTVRDTLAEVSMEQLARLAGFQAGLVERLAKREEWPFSVEFPTETRQALNEARKKWLE